MTIDILPRDTWHARPPNTPNTLRDFASGWFIHWLGLSSIAILTDSEILRNTQNYHMDTKGWSDIAYSFAIGRNAAIYELRGWGIAGGHTKGHNTRSMALVFLIGDGETPSLAMLAAGSDLLAAGEEEGYPVTLVRPHNAVSATVCPGPELTVWATDWNRSGGDHVTKISTWQQSLVDFGVELGESGPNGDGVDGDFGALTLTASRSVLAQLGTAEAALMDAETERDMLAAQLLG